jgi:hypothetical protein
VRPSGALRSPFYLVDVSVFYFSTVPSQGWLGRAIPSFEKTILLFEVPQSSAESSLKA